MFVGGVLVVASAAAAEVRAGGQDALGRGLDDRFGLGSGEPGLLLGEGGFDFLARRTKGRKTALPRPRSSAGRCGETVAAVDQLFDGEEQDVILNDRIRAPGQPPRRTPRPIGN